MKIAVITPTFNRPTLLVDCIGKLQKQTYKNWIMIIVDDGSKTNTKEYISDLIQNDNRLYFFKLNENYGCNYARNYALNTIYNHHSDIDYITFLDDDDYFKKDYFKNINSLFLEKGDKPWIVTKCIDKNNNPITKIKHYGDMNYIDYLSTLSMNGDATMMISKNAIGKVRFSYKIKNGLEWYFFLQIANKYKMFVVNIDSKVVDYQSNGLSQSKLPYNKQNLLKKYLPLYGYSYTEYLYKKNYSKYLSSKKYIYLIKMLIYKALYKIKFKGII